LPADEDFTKLPPSVT